MKMPWGKYKGISLEFINSGYFRWLLRTEDIFMARRNEDLVVAIEKEMRLRDLDSSHFYKDKVTI